ncbi:MAG TPA: HepT-like ribonuclease domain-containing protein [Gammaproteobacteria bacterium]|nr:HepT-like ribonuclease domain-containing protein [Gammaproteobacteria bacterium]
MKPLERDAAHLWDMLDAARQTAGFAAGIGLDQLLADVRTRYAIERSLEIIGEAARRVSPQTRADHPEIPWAGIIGFRNVLAHEYGAIDYRRLYAVVADGVPGLIIALEAILDSLEDTE